MARDEIRRGALFHDIGKVVTPDAILHKTAGSARRSGSIIEQHPVTGVDLLSTSRR